MIEKMTKYSFLLLSGEEEKFLSALQELGVVDITRSTKPIDDSSEKMLGITEDYRKALNELNKIDYSSDKDLDKIREIRLSPVDDPVYETFDTASQLEKLQVLLSSYEKEINRLKPWGTFDKQAIDRLDTLGYKTRYYKVPTKKFSAGWAAEYPLQVICEDGNYTYFVTISDDSEYDFPLTECEAPASDWKSIEDKTENVRNEIISCKAKLMQLKGFYSEIEKGYAEAVSNLDLYLANISSEKAADNHISIFEGFAPSEETDRLKEAFDKMDVYWQMSEASTDDNPPIKLRNNKFNRMFEVLTDMYGRPAYNGFDPTPYIALFFMLFFAFCMGDAGYGIILIIIGMLLKKSKDMANMGPLVMVLGGATFVIGILFHNFFSMDMLKWSWIPKQIKSLMLPAKIGVYDGTMVLALAIGVVHICVALIVKTIYTTKQNGFANSLGTWGWTLLIVGGVIIGGIALTGVINSDVTKWIIIVLGGISAIGIFLLNDLYSNPLKNIGTGLWNTYNTATGLLGDVLSYLRLYALGLAGSMLGYAFNDLGKMVLGDGHFGLNWVFFLLIVIIGHTLNLAMAALGAFVHPLRLNFLEFFKNSGYEAVGRNYNPLIKSDNNQ